jgi:hypothetical protein
VCLSNRFHPLRLRGSNSRRRGIGLAKTIVLFDGKDTKGWKMAGPGNFQLKDGTLVSSGGMGLYWYEKEFADCVVSVEYKVNSDKCNSGVFVRFPDPGTDPQVAIKQGHEIQILGTNTGEIYSVQKSKGAQPKPAGEWNKLEIKLQGKHYTVKLNDKIVNEFDSTDRPLKGHIGIQNHDPTSISTFRNIKVEELAPAASQPKQAAIDPIDVKDATEPGLVGEYFKKIGKLSDVAKATKPFLVRVDKNIMFRPVTGQFYKTKLSANFGARWTGYLTVEKAGPHTFAIQSDDESKLYLNDQLVIDNEKDLKIDQETRSDGRSEARQVRHPYRVPPGRRRRGDLRRLEAAGR